MRPFMAAVGARPARRRPRSDKAGRRGAREKYARKATPVTFRQSAFEKVACSSEEMLTRNISSSTACLW